MKKVFLKYLKDNRLYIIVMVVCFLALLAQMLQVVYQADDYSVGILSGSSINVLMENAVDHYLHWGGGYTPTIVISLMSLPSIVWRLVITGMVALIVAMASRMITKGQAGKKRWLVALVMWLLFFGASVHLTRETIYWLDGSMAYLFSALQAFLVFYFLYTRLFMGDKKRYDLVLIPFLCFFAGWSSAQSGGVAVLCALSLILYKIFAKKEKVDVRYWISLALTIIGFCIFYFAPGNYVRLTNFEVFNSYSLPQKILYRMSDVYALIFDGRHADFTTAPFFIYLAFGLISILSIAKAKDYRSKKTQMWSYICSGLTLLFVFGYMISTLPIPQLQPLAQMAYHYPNLMFIKKLSLKFFVALIPYLAATMAIVATLINAWILGKQEKKPFIIGALVLGLAAEFAMLLAPYSPIRTVFYTVVFAWTIIAFVIYEVLELKIRIFPVVLMVLTSINAYLGLLYILAYLVFNCFVRPKEKDKFRYDVAIFLACFGVYAAANYGTVLYGYYLNRLTNEANIQRILKFRDENHDCEEECVLYLEKPHNLIYGIADFVGDDWVEVSVRNYYKLPKNINFEYEGEEAKEEQ